MFSAQQPKCPRRFWDVDPEVVHTCSISPCQPVNEQFFFRDDNLGCLEAQTSNTKYMAKHLANNKKNTLTGWQRLIQHVRNFSEIISPKRRGLLTLDFVASSFDCWSLFSSFLLIISFDVIGGRSRRLYALLTASHCSVVACLRQPCRISLLRPLLSRVYYPQSRRPSFPNGPGPFKLLPSKSLPVLDKGNASK